MPNTLKVQNFYYTNVTSESIPSSGAFTFNVAIAPSYQNWFVVISAENTLQREIVYFHSVSGNTISVRAENRWLGGTSAKEHTQGESITMRDVAEIFNFYSDAVSTCFFVEKTGWLTVKVWGGLVYYNTVLTTVADTNLTLVDNTINYIKYSYTTNVISSDTSNIGNIKAIITVVSGAIVWIAYQTAKETYTDFTVSLNTALPSQPGNSGKFLQTDWTNATWQTQAETSNASTTVAGKVEIATQSEVNAGTTTGWTWALLTVTPDTLSVYTTAQIVNNNSRTTTTASASTSTPNVTVFSSAQTFPRFWSLYFTVTSASSSWDAWTWVIQTSPVWTWTWTDTPFVISANNTTSPPVTVPIQWNIDVRLKATAPTSGWSASITINATYYL